MYKCISRYLLLKPVSEYNEAEINYFLKKRGVAKHLESINLRKGKVTRKHSLHGEIRSLGFIEAVRRCK